MSILLCILLTALSLQLASCQAEIDVATHESKAKSSQDVGRNFNPLFPIQGLNSVLKSITDLKKQKIQLKKKAKRPNAKPKIVCNGEKDLIVVLDNIKTVDIEDFYQLLDFVGNITRFWRKNKQCHIAFIPQAEKMAEVTPAAEMPPGLGFNETMKYGDWKLLAKVYSIEQQAMSNISQAMIEATKQATGHESQVEKNVLFISSTGSASDDAVEMVKLDIQKLHDVKTPKINTFAIGVKRKEPVNQMRLEKILSNFTMKKEHRLKWINSFDDLQVSYDFVATNLL